MRAKIPIEGKGLKLVNFELEHVPLYEEWYKDKELLELTETEPMDHESLVTSQAMYAYDDDKIAFLVTVKDENGNDKYIGDCSLFIDLVDDDERDMGEFNVMIADKAYRRKGYGYYTVILVMMWAVRYAKLKEFFVKIKKYNTPSIKMFEKIGFTFYRYNRHFEENEYRIKVTNELSKKWFQEIGMPLKMFRQTR
ncbi:hypothetical protein WA577_005007 [Blastocystis sp. JDR]